MKIDDILKLQFWLGTRRGALWRTLSRCFFKLLRMDFIVFPHRETEDCLLTERDESNPKNESAICSKVIHEMTCSNETSSTEQSISCHGGDFVKRRNFACALSLSLSQSLYMSLCSLAWVFFSLSLSLHIPETSSSKPNSHKEIIQVLWISIEKYGNLLITLFYYILTYPRN